MTTDQFLNIKGSKRPLSVVGTNTKSNQLKVVRTEVSVFKTENKYPNKGIIDPNNIRPYVGVQ